MMNLEINTTHKSLVRNSILYGFKGFLNIVFPLITFPYAARILGAELIGRYEFSMTFIQYFLLIAGLGINTYAVREAYRAKHDGGKFINQIFSINVYSSILSYLLMILVLYEFPKMRVGVGITLILSLQIALTTIGVEWIYAIYEDFTYITVRSIIVHIISIILLFILVKSNDDIYQYAFITVLSTGIANIFNFIHSRKYCRIRLIRKIDIKEHVVPIIVLFGFSATVLIYVNSDITLLGLLCDEQIVGIYSASVKIYSSLKTILCAAITVAIPRLSTLFICDKVQFKSTAIDTYRLFLTYIFPIIIVIVFLRKQIVLIIGGENYVSAQSSLAILAISLFFCLAAGFWSQCILIPSKKEKIVFLSTLISAIENVVLNIILIPVWNENAAATTTLIAEMTTYIICRHYAKKYKLLTGFLPDIWKDLLKIIIGCSGVFVVLVCLRVFANMLILYVLISVVASALIYLILEVLLKNKSCDELIKIIQMKIQS